MKDNKIKKEDKIVIDALIADDRNYMRYNNRRQNTNIFNRNHTFEGDLNLQKEINKKLEYENWKYKQDISKLNQNILNVKEGKKIIEEELRKANNLIRKNKNIESKYLKEARELEMKQKNEKAKLDKSINELTMEYINNIVLDINCNFEDNILSNINSLITNFFSLENYFLSKFFFNEMKNHINRENLEEDYYSKLVYINILILGGIGNGKSTLLNSVLKLDESQGAKTGVGNSITKETKGYTSYKEPYLRIYDTKGFESNSNYEQVMKEFQDFIQNPINKGNFKDIIHCIWYCVNNRFNDYEIDGLIKFQEKYPEKALPIIIVITKDMDSEKDKEMEIEVKNCLKKRNLVANVLRVNSKEHQIKVEIINKNESDSESESDSNEKENKKKLEKIYIIKKKGIKELIDLTKDNILNAIESACFNSFIKKINMRNKINITDKTNNFKIKIINDFFQKNKIYDLNRDNYKIIINLIEKILDNFFKEKKFVYRTKLLFENFIENSENKFIEIYNRGFQEFKERNSMNLAYKQMDKEASMMQNFETKQKNKTLSEYIDINNKLINEKYYNTCKEIYFNYFITKTIRTLLEEMEKKILLEYDNLENNKELKNISNRKIRSLINNFVNKIYEN